MIFQRVLDPLFVTDEQKLELVMATTRKRRPFNHDAHTFIAAHRIDGDTRQSHVANPPRRRLKADGDDLAPVVMTARGAKVVRALQLTAVRALMECFDLQRIMAAAHAPAGRARFSLGDSHRGTCSCNYTIKVESPRPI